MPVSLLGTSDTSISMPRPALDAASTLALVRPAAPRSWMPTTCSLRAASRQASISTFSRNGLPTCTVGRSSRSSSKVRDASPDAPCMPSRPVSAPTSISRLPAPPVVAWTRESTRSRPTHIAFTSGLAAYDGEKTTSPPTSGTPMQLPYPDMPATTPSNR